MDIHEYQAKSLLAEFGVPIPVGGLAYSPEQATYRATEIGGGAWVVKAQVHTGGRGKAGGIRMCTSEQEVWEAADDLFGSRLVTSQTGDRGRGVFRIYIEQMVDIAREIYVGFVLDRATERIMMVASAAGGMEIEQIIEEEPDSLIRVVIDPAVGLQAFQAREVAFALGLDSGVVAEASNLLLSSYRAFRELDATMVEINPLVVTSDGRMLVLDAKMAFDDNALFKHQKVSELRDKSQEDSREMRANDRGLSYVGLDGDIGCIINGAGLAMATMDMIKHSGGEPANFLDIGGGASPERVAKAFNLVRSDESVRAILVNIFAGINRCDWVAEGVVKAMHELDIQVPVIVRLAGTNVEVGRRILAESDVAVITAETLAEAAEKAVNAVSMADAA